MNIELEKLHSKIRVCKKCDLYRNGNAVPGEGAADAKIIFIGEAPGRTEAETGRPFVGRAGRLLTELIESIGLKRKGVFITSPVKHRPPGNRKPKQNEIDVCMPYLTKQIEIINPRVIVLLGSTAMYALLGKKIGKITDMHGKVIRQDGIIYFPTFHPAAGLRSAKIKKKQLEQDFKKLKKIVKLA